MRGPSGVRHSKGTIDWIPRSARKWTCARSQAFSVISSSSRASRKFGKYPHIFRTFGLCNQKACSFFLSTRDRERNSCCQLHVRCQGQPRRVLSKLHQLNWVSDREHRSPFNVGSESSQALRRPRMRGLFNFSSVVPLRQPRLRQRNSIIGLHRLSRELQFRCS